MNKGNLMNNTKTRRKGSMLQDSLSKLKYFLVLAFLLVVPMQAMGQSFDYLPIVDQTDTGVDRLVVPFDTRERDTFIQVTNTASEKVNIHVQVFDVNSIFRECEECNFDDMLTENDTHVYDVENMVTNSGPGITNGGEEECSRPAGTYGFVVISLEAGFPRSSLIGMFRIIDEAGYEYRANAAGTEDTIFQDISQGMVVNFSRANGHNLADLIGITYRPENERSVSAAPNIITTFGSQSPFDEVLIWDEDEDDTSCSPTTFACAVGELNRGIDDSLPNSRGQLNRVCSDNVLSNNIAGWLDLPFSGFTCAGVECRAHFVGYIGLNNGDGTGSMDSWWEVGEQEILTLGGPSIQ
ncbi:MAG: hypothetical protein AAF462_07035 [Thermodesulfobacteriota bacterium]